jgi:hypothetical protein
MHERMALGQKKRRKDVRRIVACWSLFYEEFISQSDERLPLEGKQISPAAIFSALCKVLLCFGETFLAAISSIQAQLLIVLLKVRVQKKPRGGSRGVNDTQFFRPLVQEEEVSSRARLLVPRLRVNSILPAAVRYRLTRFCPKGI